MKTLILVTAILLGTGAVVCQLRSNAAATELTHNLEVWDQVRQASPPRPGGFRFFEKDSSDAISKTLLLYSESNTVQRLAGRASGQTQMDAIRLSRNLSGLAGALHDGDQQGFQAANEAYMQTVEKVYER